MSIYCDSFLTKPWTENQLNLLFKKLNKLKETETLKIELQDKLKREQERFETLKEDFDKHFNGSLKSLQNIFKMNSKTLYNHGKRVAIFARQTGEHLGLDEDSLEELELAALFHDFGLTFLAEKLHTTSISYLSKRDQSTYKTHPELCAKLLQSIPRFQKACEIIKLHKENVNGTGFYNMTYRSLTMETMILRICDYYDEQENFHTDVHQNILSAMSLKRDLWFDSSCLDAFLDVINKVKRVRRWKNYEHSFRFTTFTIQYLILSRSLVTKIY